MELKSVTARSFIKFTCKQTKNSINKAQVINDVNNLGQQNIVNGRRVEKYIRLM